MEGAIGLALGLPYIGSIVLGVIVSVFLLIMVIEVFRGNQGMQMSPRLRTAGIVILLLGLCALALITTF